MARRHFGTDGIRGRANGYITAEVALKLGMAAGRDLAAATSGAAR